MKDDFDEACKNLHCFACLYYETFYCADCDGGDLWEPGDADTYYHRLEKARTEAEMPCVQYPGGDYDHHDLDCEGE